MSSEAWWDQTVAGANETLKLIVVKDNEEEDGGCCLEITRDTQIHLFTTSCSRNKGLAREAMRQACAYADSEKIHLKLTIVNTFDTSPGPVELQAFYEKSGFTVDHKNPSYIYMSRGHNVG